MRLVFDVNFTLYNQVTNFRWPGCRVVNTDLYIALIISIVHIAETANDQGVGCSGLVFTCLNLILLV